MGDDHNDGFCPALVSVVWRQHIAPDDSQLTLDVDDVVYILEKDATGWWGGHKEEQEQTGWFPGNCVIELKPCDVDPTDTMFCNENAVVIKPYTAEQLQIDDVVLVIRQLPCGWCKGVKEGEDRCIWFPRTHVRPMNLTVLTLSVTQAFRRSFTIACTNLAGDVVATVVSKPGDRFKQLRKDVASQLGLATDCIIFVWPDCKVVDKDNLENPPVCSWARDSGKVCLSTTFDGGALRVTAHEGIPPGAVLTCRQDSMSGQWHCTIQPAEASVEEGERLQKCKASESQRNFESDMAAVRAASREFNSIKEELRVLRELVASCPALADAYQRQRPGTAVVRRSENLPCWRALRKQPLHNATASRSSSDNISGDAGLVTIDAVEGRGSFLAGLRLAGSDDMGSITTTDLREGQNPLAIGLRAVAVSDPLVGRADSGPDEHGQDRPARSNRPPTRRLQEESQLTELQRILERRRRITDGEAE